MLEERGYTMRKKEKEGYLHHLFFTHKDSATKVMQCPEVLIVDATYKTNVYKMPLINCVGVDNIGNSKSLHTFQIGMAWVSNEVKETYTWFLEQLKMVIYDITNTYPEVIMTDKDLALRSAADKVFPGAKKMLCIWHMLAQNLHTSTQKYFDSKDDYDNFAAAVKSYAYATTDALVTEAFDKITITTKKSKNASKIMEYLDTWKSDRSCWMQLYTQHYPHMGIHSTQRGEGSHSALKTAIEAASGLEQVFGHIDLHFACINLVEMRRLLEISWLLTHSFDAQNAFNISLGKSHYGQLIKSRLSNVIPHQKFTVKHACAHYSSTSNFYVRIRFHLLGLSLWS